MTTSRRILVVDDDSFALKLAVHQLRRLGQADVLAYASSTEALALLERDIERVDFILLDLLMPKVDGLEFVRRLGRLGYRGALALVSAEDEAVMQAAHRQALEAQLDVRGALHKRSRRASSRCCSPAVDPAASPASVRLACAGPSR